MTRRRGPSEFELIDRWLAHFDRAGEGVVLGAGDDAAVTRLSSGHVLVSTVDAFVEGVHFDRGRCPAEAVGHKALAVNLSDVASMGARPRWALLALGLPKGTDPRWLDAAARGMSSLARATGTVLVGGNVSGGDRLSLTVTLLAEARPGRVLRRDGARPGELVFVSGTVGDSAAGLRRLRALERRPRRLGVLEARHCRPTPRLALGAALAAERLASACIDVSDGLAADLGHLLEASGVGAEVRLAELPLSPAFRRQAGEDGLELAVTGGEDYELVFTAPAKRAAAIGRAAEATGTPVAVVGEIVAGAGLVLRRPDGTVLHPARAGWSHL